MALFAPFGDYTVPAATYQFQAVRFRVLGHNAEMYTEHVIAKVQRAKVIGVCSAVNMLVKLVGTLYSCKFQRALRCRGGCYGMTQVLFNITLFPTFLRAQTSVSIIAQSLRNNLFILKNKIGEPGFVDSNLVKSKEIRNYGNFTFITGPCRVVRVLFHNLISPTSIYTRRAFWARLSMLHVTEFNLWPKFSASQSIEK